MGNSRIRDFSYIRFTDFNCEFTLDQDIEEYSFPVSNGFDVFWRNFEFIQDTLFRRGFSNSPKLDTACHTSKKYQLIYKDYAEYLPNLHTIWYEKFGKNMR